MLLDHFHPPLKNTRPWTGFHSMWATKLAVAIGSRLPEGWFAAPTVHWDIEVDVATFEQTAARTVSAYRPFPSRTGPALSIWYHAVEVGKSLPSVLLFLKEGPVVELPLAETYDSAVSAIGAFTPVPRRNKAQAPDPPCGELS